MTKRPMDPLLEHQRLLTRRSVLGGAARGLGAAALWLLLGRDAHADEGRLIVPGAPGSLGGAHFAPKAKRVIYLFMSGAPAQQDMWDHKPKMGEMFDVDLPASVRMGQRITTMTSGQARFPIAPSIYPFEQVGEAGTWINTRLLPWTAKVVDKMTVIRSLHTDAINHDPAITFLNTGIEQPGRPSLGSWLSYGLGSANRDLPAFVVMHATWTGRQEAQALFSRLWGTGFLPAGHQGVAFRSQGDPVLYLTDPAGVDRRARRHMLDGLAKLNEKRHAAVGDPEIATRIAQYEMAFRMQTSVPELVDVADEPADVLELYGPDVAKPGTFAASCLLARRMAERDVRFIQIYHRGWDQHGNLPGDLPKQCHDIDQATYGLLTDLDRKGMLDETLVVWTGEFGRTVYCQGTLTREDYGRDHHPRCFTAWLAGGGIKRGFNFGATDDFSYNIVENPVHVHDLNATILHCLGIDHERLTHRFQGRDFRLTDVAGRVVEEILG